MKLRFRANASEPRLFDWYDQEPKVGDFGDVHAITKDGSEMFGINTEAILGEEE